MVFIVSTTGDGEPPDNALQFVKTIKKKTPDHYKHLCYALLGKFYDEVLNPFFNMRDTDFQNSVCVYPYSAVFTFSAGSDLRNISSGSLSLLQL